ncbi:MAG TPA: VOC family protein [Gemmatimonadaceae bacterium]|nr:VOC family protein [Gemmatimonadaceae bacterium]
MSTSRVPEDFHTITPHLVVRGVARAIEWYTRAFGAHELLRTPAPDGEHIMHSELLLGDSRFFVVDEFPHSPTSPESLGGSSVTLHLYVENVDELFDRAVDAGASPIFPVQDCFWGDRYGILIDPFGHRWSIASRLEDLSPQQQQQRARDYAKEHPW